MYNNMNAYYVDPRTYGMGPLGNVIGMGSSLASQLGHGNIAQMLGQANGMMGSISKLFPNGFGSSPFSNGFGGGQFGAQNYGGGQPYYGGSGFPFNMGQFPGMSSSYDPAGFGQLYPGYQNAGFGNMFQSLFGHGGMGTGFGGGMPGGFY